MTTIEVNTTKPESLEIVDFNSGKKIGTLPVPENLLAYFNYEKPEYVLHEVVVAYLANQRQGTHSTKTRSEVSGGGKKPWRQKHTGRARSGSIRSPLWRKGGVVFGPKPRDYYISVPKKKKVLAKYLAIVEKIKQNNLVVIDNFNVETHKTKEFVKKINNLGLAKEKVLLAITNIDKKVYLATRNLENVLVLRQQDLNPYEILNCKKTNFYQRGTIMSLDIHQIIKRPVITEKSTILKEQNKYVFEVDIKATKTEIKNAIEKMFNVDVEDIKTYIMKGKLRRYSRYEGYRPDWKKAIVKVAKGQSIKLLEELK